MEKKCRKCKQIKDVSDFYGDKYTADLLSYICIICAKEKVRNHRIKTKERNKRSATNVKEKICVSCKKIKQSCQFYKDCYTSDGIRNSCKECEKKINSKYRHSLVGRFWRYKNEHKSDRKIIEFLLTIEEFDKITKEDCFYCGRKSTEQNANGIDRVDSNKGYFIENCAPCCFVCNSMKSDRDKDFFIEHIKKIASRF